MDRVVALRDCARAGQLVERRLGETDRERAHPVGRLLGRKRCEDAGVDTTGKQDADRNIGDEVRTHRVAQPRTAFLDELGLVFAVARLQRAGIVCVARDGNLRMSVHFYNHEDDINRVVRALSDLKRTRSG